MSDLIRVISETPAPGQERPLGPKYSLRDVIAQWCELVEGVYADNEFAAADRMIAAIAERIAAMEPSEAEARAIFGVIWNANPDAFHPAFEREQEMWMQAAQAAAQVRAKGEP